MSPKIAFGLWSSFGQINDQSSNGEGFRLFSFLWSLWPMTKAWNTPWNTRKHWLWSLVTMVTLKGVLMTKPMVKATQGGGLRPENKTDRSQGEKTGEPALDHTHVWRATR